LRSTLDHMKITGSFPYWLIIVQVKGRTFLDLWRLLHILEG
jgi:hypothetical protein